MFHSFDNKHHTDIVLLDFVKAFDSIPHNELLFELSLMGITSPLWLFFKDYLSNRQHCVEIDGCRSNLLPVCSGVPQGSVVDLLLFLIFVNDIPSLYSYSSVYMLADDTLSL